MHENKEAKGCVFAYERLVRKKSLQTRTKLNEGEIAQRLKEQQIILLKLISNQERRRCRTFGKTCGGDQFIRLGNTCPETSGGTGFVRLTQPSQSVILVTHLKNVSNDHSNISRDPKIIAIISTKIQKLKNGRKLYQENYTRKTWRNITRQVLRAIEKNIITTIDIYDCCSKIIKFLVSAMDERKSDIIKLATIDLFAIENFDHWRSQIVSNYKNSQKKRDSS